MKISKLLMTYLLAAGLISCASKSLDHQIGRTPAGRSAKGGADGGGGGNTTAVAPVTETDVRNAILNIPRTLPMVLNYHEFVARDLHKNPSRQIEVIGTNRDPERASLLYRTYEILFKQHRDVFSLFRQMKFVPKEFGPCEDTMNDHKDASAFNHVPNEICFSIQRLTERLSQENLNREILAIAAHELTHRLGGNEDEATAIQDQIRLSFKGADGLYTPGIENVMEGLGDFFGEDARMEIDKLIATSNSPTVFRELPAFCLQLGITKEHISKNLENFDNLNGYVPARLRGARALAAAVFIMNFAIGFCRTSTDLKPLDYNQRLWPEGQLFDLANEEGEWQIKIEQKGHLARWGKPRDLKVLKFNLEQVRRALEILREQLDNN